MPRKRGRSRKSGSDTNKEDVEESTIKPTACELEDDQEENLKLPRLTRRTTRSSSPINPNKAKNSSKASLITERSLSPVTSVTRSLRSSSPMARSLRSNSPASLGLRSNSPDVRGSPRRQATKQAIQPMATRRGALRQATTLPQTTRAPPIRSRARPRESRGRGASSKGRVRGRKQPILSGHGDADADLDEPENGNTDVVHSGTEDDKPLSQLMIKEAIQTGPEDLTNTEPGPNSMDVDAESTEPIENTGNNPPHSPSTSTAPESSIGLPEKPDAVNNEAKSPKSIDIIPAAVSPEPTASEVDVLAQLAHRLASDDSVWNNDDPLSKSDPDPFQELTDEHIKQLESVLTSDEDMKFLTDEGGVSMLDERMLEESMDEEEAEPGHVPMEVDNETDSFSDQGAKTKSSKAAKTPVSPRRRSERVTDLERRALAEKIRQENIRKEKEELEKIAMERKEQQEREELEAAEARRRQEEEAIRLLSSELSEDKSEIESADDAEEKEPTTAKIAKKEPAKKEVMKEKVTLKKKAPPKEKGVKHKARSEKSQDTSKKSKPKQEKDEPETTVTPISPVIEGGWVPGKVKVIDRRSTDKIKKQKSVDKEQKRRLSSAVEDLFKPDEPVSKQSRREMAKKSLLGEDEVSGGEDIPSESESSTHAVSDEEWADDDPDRLWCVCRKPHDNRFMICCDRCEEWYHGDCVGISKRRGQQMEENDEEYICSVCKEKELINELGEEGMAELLRVSTTTTEPSMPESLDNEPEEEKLEKEKVKGEIRKKSASSGERKSFAHAQKKPPKQHCIGSGCENWADEGKIYCSPHCIKRHCKESLKIIHKEKANLKGAPSKDADKPVDLVVMERHTGRLVTGAHAPTQENLVAWIEKHPTFEILRPGQRTGHVSKGAFYGKTKSKLLSTDTSDSNRKPSSGSSKEPSSVAKKAQGPDPAAIRSSVRVHLTEVLSHRVEDSGDKICSSEEIQTIVSSIEHELHKYYGEPNSKYKARYRSLTFNIKDPKNKGLFRKILKKKLKPSKLVRMTADELASKELSSWREKELMSELEKIKKDEETRAQLKTSLRKITHKGEVEIQDEDLSSLDVKLTEVNKDYDPEVADKEGMAMKSRMSRITSQPSSQLTHRSYDLLGSIMGPPDTTSQHTSHLFDSNCKICTGKVSAPKPAELESRTRATIVHQVDEEKVKHERPSAKEEVAKLKFKSEVVKSELKELEKGIKELVEEDKQIEEQQKPRRVSHHSRPSSESLKARSPHQEPSSTVKSPRSPPLSPPPKKEEKSRKHHLKSCWKGFVGGNDIKKFFTTAHVVHGNTDYMSTDLTDSLEIVGRIQPNQIWEYLNQLKHSMTREVILLRFSPVSEYEEKEHYKEYFLYLSSKKRCGVVGNTGSAVKDMYIIPLPSHDSLPSALKPYRHKVLADDNRPHMLLGLIVRSRKQTGDPLPLPQAKKVKQDMDAPYEPPGIAELTAPEPGDTPTSGSSSADTPTPDAAGVSQDDVEEYDPANPDVGLQTDTLIPEAEDSDMDEAYDPIVSAYSHADSSQVDDGDAPYSPGEPDEPYSPDAAVEPDSPGTPADSPPSVSADEPYDPLEPTLPAGPSGVPPSTIDTDELPPLPPDNPDRSTHDQVKELTEQQTKLQELTAQVEKQRIELEKQRALMEKKSQLEQNLPKNIADIMTGKTLTESSDPKPYNMMDYLKRSIEAEKAKGVELPPLPPTISTLSDPSSQGSPFNRTKIAFSIGNPKPQLVRSPAAKIEVEENVPKLTPLPRTSAPEPYDPGAVEPPPPGVTTVPFPKPPVTVSQPPPPSIMSPPPQPIINVSQPLQQANIQQAPQPDSVRPLLNFGDQEKYEPQDYAPSDPRQYPGGYGNQRGGYSNANQSSGVRGYGQSSHGDYNQQSGGFRGDDQQHYNRGRGRGDYRGAHNQGRWDNSRGRRGGWDRGQNRNNNQRW